MVRAGTNPAHIRRFVLVLLHWAGAAPSARHRGASPLLVAGIAESEVWGERHLRT